MKAELTLPERPAVVHLLAVLDVLVLLLVFFILIANVARESGVAVVSPPASEYRLQQFGPKVVVTAHGGAAPLIFVGLKRVGLEGLEGVLKSEAAAAGAETMLLHADQMLPVDVERQIIEVGLKLDLNVMLVASREHEATKEIAPSKPVIPDPDEKLGP